MTYNYMIPSFTLLILTSVRNKITYNYLIPVLYFQILVDFSGPFPLIVRISRHLLFRMLVVRCLFVVEQISAMRQHCRRNDGRYGRSVLQLANFLWKWQEAGRFSVRVV